MTKRRKFVQFSVAASLGALTGSLASAQGKIRGAARFVIGFPAGSGPDVLARGMAESMRHNFADSLIVENRVGAAGRIALEHVKRAAADGTTLTIIPNSMLALYPYTYPALRYNPVEDFTPIALIGRFSPVMVVGPAVPASVKTPTQFVEWVKTQPGKSVNFSGNVQGAAGHFLGLEFAKKHDISLSFIPFKAGNETVQALLGGHLPMASFSENYILGGGSDRMRALAICSAERSPRAPNVPTFKELGQADLTTEEWLGLFGPGGMSADLVKQMYGVWKEASATPRIRDLLSANAINIATNDGPADVARLLKADLAYYEPVIRASGVRFEE